MENVSHEIERLIVRRLDGELTEDEALQLNRELIRNPDAQRLLEDYARVDAMASGALEEALVGGDREFDASMLAPRMDPTGRRPRHLRRWRLGGWRLGGWWLVPGAVAAALLALMIPKPGFDGGPQASPEAAPPLVDRTSIPVYPPVAFPNADRPGGPVTPSVMDHAPRGSDLMRTVSQRPSARRRTGRDVIGVMGDDGNLYWIEVDRTRTIRRRPTQHRARGYDEL